MKIKIEVEAILDAVAEMNETEQKEFIVNVAEIVKPQKSYLRKVMAAAILNGLSITESDFKEIGEVEFDLYDDGPERDTAANTLYKY